MWEDRSQLWQFFMTLVLSNMLGISSRRTRQSFWILLGFDFLMEGVRSFKGWPLSCHISGQHYHLQSSPTEQHWNSGPIPFSWCRLHQIINITEKLRKSMAIQCITAIYSSHPIPGRPATISIEYHPVHKFLTNPGHEFWPWGPWIPWPPGRLWCFDVTRSNGTTNGEDEPLSVAQGTTAPGRERAADWAGNGCCWWWWGCSGELLLWSSVHIGWTHPLNRYLHLSKMSAIPNSLSKTCMIHLKDLGETDWTDIIIQAELPKSKTSWTPKTTFPVPWHLFTRPSLLVFFLGRPSRNPHAILSGAEETCHHGTTPTKDLPGDRGVCLWKSGQGPRVPGSSRIPGSPWVPGCTKLKGKMAVTRCWANRVFLIYLGMNVQQNQL